ncbi:MAG: YfhO family protein, partial [Acidobacteria bacterium]|nr:YfhO family protein [Acidobacteriota bacterium]
MRWTLEVVSESGSRGAVAWLVAALTAVVYAGALQMAVYIWLFVAVLGIAYWLASVRRARGILELAGAAGVAALTSAPLWLPAYLYLTETSRMGAVGLSAFLGRAGQPGAWADILLPVYCYHNGFLEGRASVYLHQGAWVAPGILGGLAVAWRQRGRLDGLGRPLAATLACAALFYELARGEYGWLLRLTYGLPVWSSFRDAFKFLPFFLATAALAAGLGLEICWRQERGRAWLVGLAVALAMAAGLILVFPGMVLHAACPSTEMLRTWGGRVGLGAGLVVLLLACAAAHRRVRQILLVAAALEMAGVLSLCHYHSSKTYWTPYAAVGPRELGIENQYRVVPLSHSRYSAEVAMEEYGVFHSATANGYYSATGHYTSYLAPSWRDRWLRADEEGVPAPPWNHALLGSHLLRSFNVRYVIVGKHDPGSVALVSGHPDYRLLRETGDTWVYEDPQALPRAYFASETRVYSEEALRRGLVENQAPRTTAYVEEWPAPGAASAGEVQQLEWGNRVIRCRVQAPAGGFLVISTTWDPGWRAQVDGAPARIYRVNGTLLGLALPRGARDVVVRYTAPGFLAGLGLLGAGAAVLAVWRRRR